MALTSCMTKPVRLYLSTLANIDVCKRTFGDAIRKVEKKDRELYNVEFAIFAAVKDRVKASEQK